MLFIFLLSTLSIDFAGIKNFYNIEISLIFYITRSILSIITLFLTMCFFLTKSRENYFINMIVKGIIFIFIVFIFIIINSILQKTLTIELTVKLITSLGLYLYILLYGLINKKFIENFFYVFMTIIIINYFTYLLYPEIGVFKYSSNGIGVIKGIMANRNSIALIVLPALLLVSYLRINKILYFVLVSLCYLQLLLTFSATAIFIGITVILLKVLKFKNLKLLTVLSLLVNVSFVALSVFNESIKTKMNTLDQNNDIYGGRLDIWETAINNMDFHGLMLGYGQNNFVLTNYLNGLKGTNGVLINTPMNGIISMIYENGILFSVIIVIYILKTLKINFSNEYYLGLYIPVIILASIGESFFTFTFTLTFSVFLAWYVLSIKIKSTQFQIPDKIE